MRLALRTSLLLPAACIALSAQDPGQDLSGKVVETMNGGGYTYVKLEKGGKQTWVAIPETKITVGADMEFQPGAAMANFPSKTLNRVFDLIYFSAGAKGAGLKGLPHPVPGMAEGLPPGHPGGQTAAKDDGKPVKVAKATGPNAFTVAQLFAKRGPAAGRTVVVRGKVVKVSTGILGRTWVHLQDGSGSAVKGTNNLVVTTTGSASLGEVLIATGKLARDKDFGQGYHYSVLVEDASLKK
jgi:hypothetical protein